MAANILDEFLYGKDWNPYFGKFSEKLAKHFFKQLSTVYFWNQNSSCDTELKHLIATLINILEVSHTYYSYIRTLHFMNKKIKCCGSNWISKYFHSKKKKKKTLRHNSRKISSNHALLIPEERTTTSTQINRI